MTNANELREIVALYTKHGWNLRRVSLSSASTDEIAGIVGDVPIVRDSIDGLWFSRRSIPGTESWELRRLGGTPYAVVAVIDDSADDESRELELEALATRIRESSKAEDGRLDSAARRRAH